MGTLPTDPPPYAPPRAPSGCGGTVGQIFACGCLIVLVAFGLLVLAVAAATHREGQRVQSALAQLRAAGEPLTNAELAPPSVPANENAALLYLKAADIIKPHEGTLSPHVVGYDTALWSSAADVDALVRLARQDQRAADLIRQATRRPECRFDELWAGRMLDAPSVASKLGAIAEFEGAAALAAARQGHRSEALERLTDGFVLSRRLAEAVPSRGPSAARSLDRTLMWPAQYVAAHGPLPEPGARRLAQELGRLDCRRSGARQVQVWRVLAVELADDLKSGHPSSGGKGMFPRVGGPTDFQFWFYGRPARLRLYKDELLCLGLLQRAQAIAGQPWREAQPEVQRLEGDLRRVGSQQLAASWVGLLVPNTFADADRVLARRAVLQAALGLEVYRQHHGRYPDTLRDLASLHWPLADDPFSGKPLVYRRKGNDYLLYSLGVDLDDDGGRPLPSLVRDEAQSQALYRAHPGPDDGDLVWLPWR
ncbi:MAG: hypothetical protein FJX75_17450 [Armatimonadetes bacterium]|nr:hypothetical protein [Armatimonadota bacterium]